MFDSERCVQRSTAEMIKNKKEEFRRPRKRLWKMACKRSCIGMRREAETSSGLPLRNARTEIIESEKEKFLES